MKLIVWTIFTLFSLTMFGQNGVLNFKDISKENEKIKLNIHTLHCDTTIKYDKLVGPCLIASVGIRDTIPQSDSAIFSKTITCVTESSKGLNLFCYENGERESIGFVKVKYSLTGFWPKIKKTYVRQGFWVYYKNGKFFKTENFGGQNSKYSMVQIHPNGKIEMIRIINKNNIFTEIFDDNGVKIKLE
jgi:hypothetical protein